MNAKWVLVLGRKERSFDKARLFCLAAADFDRHSIRSVKWADRMIQLGLSKSMKRFVALRMHIAIENPWKIAWIINHAETGEVSAFDFFSCANTLTVFH